VHAHFPSSSLIKNILSCGRQIKQLTLLSSKKKHATAKKKVDPYALGIITAPLQRWHYALTYNYHNMLTNFKSHEIHSMLLVPGAV
jgi:hypothetical protein